ncbi:MAG: hypothetical protein IJ809_04810 [Clostridia bacterium]|nr:hypothetical protein [Clostridia bacterium]
MEILICFANSSVEPLELQYISYFCIALFGIKIITTRYSVKEILIMSVVLGICAYSTAVNGDSRVMWFALAICAMKNVKFKDIVEISFFTMLSCVVVFIILFAFGFTKGVFIGEDKGTRISLGLGHPNMFSEYYNLLLLHLVFLWFDKIKPMHIIWSFFGAIAIYLYSKSVTGIMVYMALLLAVVIYKYKIFEKIKIREIFPYIIIAGIIAFTVLPIIYDSNNGVMVKLDSFFTGRFSQANYYFQKYGINLFGSDVSFDLNTEWVHAILDIGYTRMLIYNGIFYYLLVVIPLVVSMILAEKKKKYPLLIMLVVMCVYMYTENVATYVFMNVSMLYFSSYIFKTSGEKVCVRRRKYVR